MFKIDRPYNIGLGYAQHVTIRSMIPRPKSIKSKGKLIILGARKKIWGARAHRARRHWSVPSSSI